MHARVALQRSYLTPEASCCGISDAVEWSQVLGSQVLQGKKNLSPESSDLFGHLGVGVLPITDVSVLHSLGR